MDKLELTFRVEKDTKNTRRYQEEARTARPSLARSTLSAGVD